MAEWISVKERLPEPLKRVLVAMGPNESFEIGTTTIMFLGRDGGWYPTAEAVPMTESDERISVTHWMPMPEPPEED